MPGMRRLCKKLVAFASHKLVLNYRLALNSSAENATQA